MKVTSCVGPSCGRPYQINRFSDTTISAPPGKITCPHCGAVTEGEANAVFMTHALSAAEEAEFKASNESGGADESTGASENTGANQTVGSIEGAGSSEEAPAAIGDPPRE